MSQKNSQKGFAPIVVVLVVIISVAGFVTIKKLPFNETQINPQLNFQRSNSAQIESTSSPTITTTNKLTPVKTTPTVTPKSSPTHTPIPNSGNNSNNTNPTATPTPLPTITITSPNGGVNWTVGETKTVSWSESKSKYVRIYIEDPTISNSGSTNYIYDGTITASQGSYNWNISQNQLPNSTTLPRNYRLRIDGVDETTLGAKVVSRGYSGSFTISTPTPTPTPKTYIHNGTNINATTICNPNSQSSFNVQISGNIPLQNQNSGVWTTLTGNGSTIITSYNAGGSSTVTVALNSINGSIASIREGNPITLQISNNTTTYGYELKVFEAPFTTGTPNLNNQIGNVSFATDCR